MENTIECSICMEDFFNPRVIPCGHSYCSNPRNCLSQMLRLNTPPRCAVCKNILPRDLKEEDVPRNFALSAAIDARQAGPSTVPKKTDSDICPEHNKTRKFFCRPCSSVFCKKCWETDHVDPKKHEVVPFSLISNIYASTEEKLMTYEKTLKQLSESVLSISQKSCLLREDLEHAKKSAKLAREATSPSIFDGRVNQLKLSLENSQKILDDILNTAIAELEDTVKQASSALQEAGNIIQGAPLETDRTIFERNLKETRLSSIVKGNVVSRKRTFDKSAVDEEGNVICLRTYFNGRTQIECFKITEGQLTHVSSFIWDFREGTDLVDIVCVNNQFIGVSMSFETRKRSLHLVDKSTLEFIRELHLQGLDEHSEEDWCIAGYDEALAVLVRETTDLFLFRGPQFRLVSRVEALTFSFSYLLLSSMDTVLGLYPGKWLVIINFEQNGSSRKRLIKLDGCKLLRYFVFLPYPKSDSLQGFLSGEFFDEGNMITNLYFLDLKSVKHGDVIQPLNESIWTPKFKNSLKIFCTRGPHIIFCQDRRDIFDKQETNERKADYTTLTFH